ncbi:Beta-glucosidase [Purpureocillium takamizusanense]|uniref:Beta-glucosidase n=1 Tax=Purpureocillium takamizusanense TaxID=2060973 RepID=A0A9Q8QM88_9HYPO|nr:Beta-glucosidase [Purpureocillium takamizusanense]UNI22215.1 Beta-glucosidase [Purpureocillium takamizusanense]
MRILLLCTAHNSLSQRLSLVLSKNHSVTVEYALSDATVIEGVRLAQPHLIICPFLTTRVPQEVYGSYLTLIVHPGPPGDAGPSALDWLLMGDDGTEPDCSALLEPGRLSLSAKGRSHWGVTVLQAIGEFDAGQVWAFDQFPVDIDESGLTKSSLYRGAITRAAISAVLAAIERIEQAPSISEEALSSLPSPPESPACGRNAQPSDPHPASKIHPDIVARKEYALSSVSSGEQFRGGQTRCRPFLKAAHRDFDPKIHTATEIARRIRSADSQPGCLSSVFGPKLYLYGGLVEEAVASDVSPGSIVAIRDEAVCVAAADQQGIWITHIRRVKSKTDPELWPKVPAASGLVQLGLVPNSWLSADVPNTCIKSSVDEWTRKSNTSFQEIWVDFAVDENRHVAYVHFELYNGAMSTAQCKRLCECLRALLRAADNLPLTAVILMGGRSYFSNGIHLNVIEASRDPALESWYNINAINDVTQLILGDFPSRGVTTVAAVRGNCAAGGVALAAACDVVLVGEHVVLNPAYRALGLHGSEFHALSYPGRCGTDGATTLLRSMTPLSADDALDLGLIDVVVPGHGDMLDAAIQQRVDALLAPKSWPFRNVSLGRWKRDVDLSAVALAQARAAELAQMSMDFWSARSERYHGRRRAFVRKTKPSSTPLRFASHRRGKSMLDQEELDSFDSVEWFAERSRADGIRQLCGQISQLADDFSRAPPDDRASEKASGPSKLSVRKPGSTEGVDHTSSSSGLLFPCYYTL